MTEHGPDELEAGRYRIENRLGAGGMGEVWAAEDKVLSRRVAIKLLRESLIEDSTLRSRFQLEIKAAAVVEHPNIVPVYDVGFDHGRPFIVMRLIDGPDLRTLLEDGPLEPSRALDLFKQIAAAVQAVHEQSFIHRDVKPANILIGQVGHADEYAALTDFGIVKALEDPGGLTKGRPPGTPLYMAPETWAHWAAEPEADQYALACVLFQMLTGRPPFQAESFEELEEQHCEAAPPALGQLLPEAPSALADALARALSKLPQDRFANVAAFAAQALSEPFDDQGAGETDRLQLSPNGVSTALFGIAPDRDERAPQLAMETYLTMWANGYAAPEQGALRPPKRRNAALRSLALGVNFLEGLDEPGPSGRSPEQLGDALAAGGDFSNSANLGLAQKALRALVDPQTEQGSAGASLMLPFHESLLWFDARRSGSANARWAVRKVNMRGSGITLARMLLDPPALLGGQAATDAAEAREAVKQSLKASSPFAQLAERLQAATPEPDDRLPEPAETSAWHAACEPSLTELGRRVIRHARNIASNPVASPSARLLQLRSILALDVAHHILRRSWDASEAPADQRFLLLTYSPEARRVNRVRIASEASYQAARQSIVQAIVATIGRRAAELSNQPGINFHTQFENRSGLAEIADLMGHAPTGEPGSFAPLAGRVYEEAKGGGYGRPVDAFRVLLESVGLLSGTGAYRWLRAGADLLGGMISAIGDGPVESPEFLAQVRNEWDLVVGEAEAVGTGLEDVLDGGVLIRNAQHLERLLTSSGLAQSLSDQTCIVGQRLKEAT